MENYDSIIAQIDSSKNVKNILSKNKKLVGDKNFYIALSKKKLIDENTLGLFDEKVRGDKEVITEVLGTWPHQDAYKHATDKIKEDKNIAFEAIKARDTNIEFISDKLKEDRKFMLDVASSIYMHSKVLQFLPKKYRNDKEFLMILLKKDYQSFEYISEDLKNDQELVWSAMFDCNIWYAPVTCYLASGQKVKEDKDFFQKASAKLKEYRQSKELIASIKEAHKIAVANSKGASAGAVAEIKATLKNFRKEFAAADSWTASQSNKNFTNYLEKVKEFSKDKKIMEMLVEADLSQKTYYAKNIGQSIKVMDEKLQKDTEFLSKLMEKTEGKVFEFLPSEIKKDKNFIIANYSSNIKKEHLDKDLTQDAKFILELAKSCAGSRLFLMSRIKYIVDDKLLSNKEFIEKFVEFDGGILDNVSNDIKKDKTIVKKAIGSFRNALAYADKSLLTDKELLKYSLSQGGDSFMSDLSMEQLADKDFLLDLLTYTKKDNTSLARSIMRSIPYSLKKDKELVLACVSRSGWSIENADDSVKYDKDILTVAFKTGCHMYKELDLKKLRSLYEPKELKKIAGSMYEYVKE